MDEQGSANKQESGENPSTPIKKLSQTAGVSSHSKLKMSKAAENFNRDFKTIQITSETPETSKYYWDPGHLFQNQFIRSQSNTILNALTGELQNPTDPPKSTAVDSQPQQAQMTTPTKPIFPSTLRQPATPNPRPPATGLLDPPPPAQPHSQPVQAVPAEQTLTPIKTPLPPSTQTPTRPTPAAADTAAKQQLDPTWCKQELLRLRQADRLPDESRDAALGKRQPVYLSVPRFFAAGEAGKPEDKRVVSESLTQLLPEIISLINHSVATSKDELIAKKNKQILDQDQAKLLDSQGAEFFSKLGAQLCSVIGILVDQRLGKKRISGSQ